MFVTGNDNSEIVRGFLTSPGSKRMAVAFIGAGVSESLRGESRIVCNLTSGATNPAEVEKIISHCNSRIKNYSALHAKVYVSDHRLVVGSANLSTNGIGLERLGAGWLEAALVTEDYALIQDAQAWFDGLWDQADDITPAIMDAARKAYQRVRSTRPWAGLELEDLRDRDIHCVIYKSDACSEDADRLMVDRFGEQWEEQGYGIYEQWGSVLPEGLLLDFCLKRGRLSSTGVWKNDGYQLESAKTDVQIVKYVPEPDLPVERLTPLLRQRLDHVWPGRRREGGTVLHINQLLDAVTAA